MKKRGIPEPIYNYVLYELRTYYNNKKDVKQNKDSLYTDEIISVVERLEQIENALNKMPEYDRKIADILLNGQGWCKAEIEGYSRSAFYKARDRIIFTVAKEMKRL